MIGTPTRPTLGYDNRHLASMQPSWLKYKTMKEDFTDGCQPQRRKPFYQCTDPGRFDLAKFCKPENLRTVFGLLGDFGGPGTGIDGVTYKHFASVDVFPVLKKYSKAIRDKSYRPRETKPVAIEKPTGGVRNLAVPCIGERTVAKALDLALKPLLAPQLPLLTQSVWPLYKNLEAAVRKHGTFVLVTDDIQRCFDEVIVADVLDCFAELFSTQSDLFWLVETVIRGHQGPERLVGLDQGNPFSPTAMELMLHNRLDVPLQRGQKANTSRFRYVDNILSLHHDAQTGINHLARVNQILSEHQMVLKGQDQPIDLRDLSHRHAVLGFLPYWVDDQLEFRIPNGVYGELRQKLEEADRHANASELAWSIVMGFIHSHGCCLSERNAVDVKERLAQVLCETGFWEMGGCLDATITKAYQKWLAC